MARFTDYSFRQLCKECGADVMVTEFVMSDALLNGGDQAWRALDFSAEQRPMGVQIFGSHPGNMARAAGMVEARLAPDFLDINCGCPADRVTDQNAGSSLLRDPARLERIVDTVVRALKQTPVTVKIRTGWDADSIVALEVGRRVRDAGAAALTVHGRTREQGYRGEADWTVINAVAAELDIPVIGNGGIRTCGDVMRLRQSSPVAGLMIGRAAQGYPWIFSEIKHYLATGESLPPPEWKQRWETILRYADLLLRTQYAHKDHADIRWMRPKLKALTKDMPKSKHLRVALDTVVSMKALQDLVNRYMQNADL